MNDIYQDEFMNAFKRLIDETTTDALLVHDTKLEDRIDDLESQASDHEDRIDMLTDVENHQERIEELEIKLEKLDDLNDILDRKIQNLLQTGRIKLYLASEPPTQ